MTYDNYPRQRKSLQQIQDSIGGMDRGVGMHDYLRHYEIFFEPYRDRQFNMLEIGVEFGLSARMWLEYFPKATIWGVDINDHNVRHDRFHFQQGDQRDPVFWHRFLTDKSFFDIVIDDGAHCSSAIITTFEAVWPKVQRGGYFCVEDLMCSYHGHMREPGWPPSTEYFKLMVDNINAQTAYKNTDAPRLFAPGTVSSLDIDWMRVSEELVILKKK